MVITVLAIFAALIVPNLLNESRGREARQFFSKARNLMLEARSRSIGDQQTRTVRVDESGGRLIVERIDQTSLETVEDKTLDLPEGVAGSAYRMADLESNSAEWEVRFYADGKSSGGGVTFTTNSRPISIIVDKSGAIRQVDGELPDTQDESWDAGGYEQRV